MLVPFPLHIFHWASSRQRFYLIRLHIRLCLTQPLAHDWHRFHAAILHSLPLPLSFTIFPKSTQAPVQMPCTPWSIFGWEYFPLSSELWMCFVKAWMILFAQFFLPRSPLYSREVRVPLEDGCISIGSRPVFWPRKTVSPTLAVSVFVYIWGPRCNLSVVDEAYNSQSSKVILCRSLNL